MKVTGAAALQFLQACLEEEIDALQEAMFRLEVQQAVLTTGRHRWLGGTTSDVEGALRKVRSAEAALREALSSAAVAIGLSPEATLREVAEAAPEPWGFVFASDRENVLSVVAHLSEIRRTNHKLLAQGLASTSAAIEALGAEPQLGYDATGTRRSSSGSLGLLNARA